MGQGYQLVRNRQMKIIVLDQKCRLCLLCISMGILLLMSRLLHFRIEQKGFSFLGR
jgi:hypothetical protein